MIPSVTDKYPIKNSSWWKLEEGVSLNDQKLMDEIYKSVALQHYIRNVRMLNGEVFMARLESARSKENMEATNHHPKLLIGHTYDPWWRSITEHRNNHYQKINHYEVGFETDVSCMIRDFAGSIEKVLLWGFSNTIDKVPVYLFLYTFSVYVHTNEREEEEYEQRIHPFNCSTKPDYNLYKKDIDPYASIGNIPHTTIMTQSYMDNYFKNLQKWTDDSWKILKT